MNFNKIRSAIHELDELEKEHIIDIAEKFAEYSNQIISNDIIVEWYYNFHYSGFSNRDFLTSDFLPKHGLKNLLEVNKPLKLEDVEISVRLYSILRKSKIEDLSTIDSYEKVKEFDRVRGYGKKTKIELMKLLNKYDILN